MCLSPLAACHERCFVRGTVDLWQHWDCETLRGAGGSGARWKSCFGSDPVITLSSSSRFPCLVSFDFSSKMVVFEEWDDVWVPFFNCYNRCECLPQGKEKSPILLFLAFPVLANPQQLCFTPWCSRVSTHLIVFSCTKSAEVDVCWCVCFSGLIICSYLLTFSIVYCCYSICSSCMGRSISISSSCRF